MKRVALGKIGIKLAALAIIAVIFMVYISSAPEVVGSWKGTLYTQREGILDIQTQELPSVFNISEENGVYTSTFDVPSRGAFGLATDSTSFKDNVLEIVIGFIDVHYKGTFDGSSIKGTLTQYGMEISLELRKGEQKRSSKPQEPKEPIPYRSEEVNFVNSKAGNIKFSGTLTLPRHVKNPPVAILISGSGTQNRDGELLGHKPFLVLADHLTRKGIAVLRYDDRVFVAATAYEGDIKEPTSLNFAEDVAAAVAYLQTRKDVLNTSKIGLIGYSEGGLIAPIVASKNNDIAFCVLLAGPGVIGKEVLLTQTRNIVLVKQTIKNSEVQGGSTEDIDLDEKYADKIFDILMDYKGEASDKKILALYRELKNLSSETVKAQLTYNVIQQQLQNVTSPWLMTFLKLDPQLYLSKVQCPVLAINGEKDFQVLSKLNLEGIVKGLKAGNNKDFTTQELKDLNHLFQTSDTGASSEYATIEETFSPSALNLISDWIAKRF
ncbi:hypothetical protein JYT44_00330 [Caldithrix abyssi]|nr:hypothetical protein [Caldithrix abyssi]